MENREVLYVVKCSFVFSILNSLGRQIQISYDSYIVYTHSISIRTYNWIFLSSKFLQKLGIEDDSPGLNLASKSATSRDLLQQAKDIVIKMKDDPKIDFRNDWKVRQKYFGHFQATKEMEKTCPI